MLTLMKRNVFYVLVFVLYSATALSDTIQASTKESITKCYESQNSKVPSSEFCESALKMAMLEEDKALILSNLSLVQFREGQKTKALNSITEAISLTPSNSSVFVNLSNLKIRQSLFLEALEALELAVQYGGSQQPAIYLNRTIALSGLGRFLEARENYIQYRLLIEPTGQKDPREAEAK